MKQKSKSCQIIREPIIAKRVRKIEGGFSFIEHRFLHQGFFAQLSQTELVLYLFLVLVGDRRGISFYGTDAVCSVCQLSLEAYLFARNELIVKDLIAFDGRRFQVLSLPKAPKALRVFPLQTNQDFEEHDEATIRQILQKQFTKYPINKECP